jgi:hypothetical protein
MATLAAAAAGAQSVDDVLGAGDRRVRLAQASQEKIDEVVEDTRALVDQYNRVTKEIEGLEVYNALMDRQIRDQTAELQRLADSIDQVTVIERQIMPLMLRMIDGLEKFVALDVPFLIEERRDRVQRLHELMERSDVSVAEKFRNVLEAYQIENDFGRTIEAYKGTLEIEGGTREVDFLRVGRVALLYQTVDGAFTGAWSRDTGAFEPLTAGTTRTQVRQGLRMARKEVAPDLLILPVAAPEPVR